MRRALAGKQRGSRAAAVRSAGAGCVWLCEAEVEVEVERSGQLQVDRSASVTCSCIALPLSAAPCLPAPDPLSPPPHSLLAPSTRRALVLCLSVYTAYQSCLYLCVCIYSYIYRYIYTLIDLYRSEFVCVCLCLWK
jgi:hypothetical protein